jgi:hypothetical protein
MRSACAASAPLTGAAVDATRRMLWLRLMSHGGSGQLETEARSAMAWKTTRKAT